MTDNMCGPSNPGKSLANHIEQDRSLHQDRVGSGSSSQQSFRSYPSAQFVQHANEFRNFSTSPATLPPAFASNVGAPAPPPAVNTNWGPQGFPYQSMTPVQNVTYGNTPYPHAPLSQAHYPNAPPQDWIYDFSSLSISNNHTDHSMNADAMRAGPLGYNAQAQYQQFPDQHRQIHNGLHQPIHAQHPHMVENQLLKMQLFADLQRGELERQKEELEKQARTDAENKAVFDSEMALWMESNGQNYVPQMTVPKQRPKLGPGASKLRFQTTGNSETAVASSSGINSTQSSKGDALAEDTVNTELAQVARQVVQAVSDDQSEKFRSSNFFEMMRRIAAGEVVLKDNNLVDLAKIENDVSVRQQSGFGSSVTGSKTANAPQETTSEGPEVRRA